MNISKERKQKKSNNINRDNYTKKHWFITFLQKITLLFISAKLDSNILISCKLVLCVAWKDGIALNETSNLDLE